MRRVTDEMGRTVEIPVTVRRIVSLAPNLTETIYALGAQERLAGVTDYSDFPAEARLKPHVGAPLSPSLEAIAGLQPDLVLAARSINRRETVEALAQAGIAVYATDANTVEGVLESIRHIGAVIGAETQADELVANLQQRLGRLTTRLQPLPSKHVLFVIWLDPLITIGPHTFLADAVRHAGGESVIDSNQDWPQVSLEAVYKLQPDEIVFATDHAEQEGAEISSLQKRPDWSGLTAVKNGCIVTVSEAIDRPAPRLVDAIEQLARALHPEALVETQPKSGRDGDAPVRDELRPGAFAEAQGKSRSANRTDHATPASGNAQEGTCGR
jgi:iron complex transport system substrate-binding protein